MPGRTQDGAVRTTQDGSSRCVRGKVSLSCISRLIFVAHGTGKFPSEEEMRDTRQNLRWQSRQPGWRRPALPSAPHRAHLSGCPIELGTGDVRGLALRLS